MAGYVSRWYTRPKTVTHPTANKCISCDIRIGIWSVTHSSVLYLGLGIVRPWQWVCGLGHECSDFGINHKAIRHGILIMQCWIVKVRWIRTYHLVEQLVENRQVYLPHLHAHLSFRVIFGVENYSPWATVWRYTTISQPFRYTAELWRKEDRLRARAFSCLSRNSCRYY